MEFNPWIRHEWSETRAKENDVLDALIGVTA